MRLTISDNALIHRNEGLVSSGLAVVVKLALVVSFGGRVSIIVIIVIATAAVILVEQVEPALGPLPAAVRRQLDHCVTWNVHLKTLGDGIVPRVVVLHEVAVQELEAGRRHDDATHAQLPSAAKRGNRRQRGERGKCKAPTWMCGSRPTREEFVARWRLQLVGGAEAGRDTILHPGNERGKGLSPTYRT